MAAPDYARAGPAGQTSQADCRAMFDAVSDAILINDAQSGAILDVNQGMREMFGYTLEEARQLTVMALCGSETEPQTEGIRSLLAQAAAGSPQVFECQARDRAGRLFWVEVHLKPIRLAGGDRILAVVRDIDQRKLAEEALQTHTRVLESMAEGVTVADADGKIIFANPAFDAMFGYQPGELIGQHVSVLNDFSPSESVNFVQEMLKQLPSKRILSGEVRNRKKDGTKFYTQARISALAISGKTCWILVQEDITERKQFEDALRESEASYRIVTEGSLAGVYLIQDDKFRYVNPVLAQAFGYRPDEIIDRLGPLDLVHPEDRARVAGDMQRRLGGEGVGAPHSFKGVRQDGSVIFCEVLTRQVEYQGRPAIMGTLLDITERRRAEEARKASFEELEGLVAERTAGLQAANVQLRREIEERRRTEAIIRLQRDLGLTLSGKVELRETLRLCVETAIAISGLDSGGVYLIDPVSGDLDLAYHQGFSPEFVRSVSHYPADALNTYMVMAGRPVYARLSDLPGILDEEGLKEGLRSATIIPVIHQDQVIACINIASHQYEEVPATARAALETLAAQVGSAIARVQAEEALRRAKEDLEIRVAERTAQLQQANESLEEELRVRRTIEESLRQSEAKYRTLVEQIPAITYIVSLTDQVGLLYISPQIETLLGFSPEEWRADGRETWERQLHPEDRERVLAEIAHCFDSGEPFATEYRVLAKSGRVVWFRDEARVVHDQEGKLLFLQGLALDITERKQAEEALKETTHTLQTLVQASPLAILARNPAGEVISWNPAAERMFGWTQEEVIGRPLPIIPKEEMEEFQALEKRKLQGTTILGLELRRQRRDGSRIDIRLSSAPLQDGAGNIIGIVGIIEDITARKRMEETLRQVSRALKAITECHQALIRATNEAELLNEVCRIIVGVGGYRMAWVGYAEQDADKSVRPVAQKGLDEGYVEQLQITWADTERGRGPSGKAIRLGKPAICRDTDIDPDVAFAREEVRKRGYASILALPLKDGRTFGVLTIYASAPDAFDDEEVTLLMGLANDLAYGITALRARADQRRAEEALKESEQELRLLTARLLSIQEQERRRVARELHDELGQALTVLKIQLVAIEDKLSPDQEHLRANCEQMLSYIDTVIENVRRLSWDLSPSSLEDLGLSSALGYLVDGICRDHNLRSTVAMDKIDHLFSPETQINIYRIFQESLTNVVKHARASLIAVKVTKEDGKVSFRIRDNGRGFNLRRAISRKGHPQSLGLTAMNERALMAAGSLQISSRKGRGTTIRFSIPIDTPGR